MLADDDSSRPGTDLTHGKENPHKAGFLTSIFCCRNYRRLRLTISPSNPDARKRIAGGRGTGDRLPPKLDKVAPPQRCKNIPPPVGLGLLFLARIGGFS